MKQKNNFLGKLKRYRVLLLMLLPAVLYVILFNYIPMAGIVLAFKKYNCLISSFRYTLIILGSFLNPVRHGK